MKEYDRLTFENLPEAVQHLINDVEEIKHLLLNQSASPKPAPKELGAEKDFLNVTGVAELLGFKKGTVYNLTHKQEIPHFKRGGRVYFDKKEVDDWIRANRRKTVQQLKEEAEIENRKK